MDSPSQLPGIVSAATNTLPGNGLRLHFASSIHNKNHVTSFLKKPSYLHALCSEAVTPCLQPGWRAQSGVDQISWKMGKQAGNTAVLLAREEPQCGQTHTRYVSHPQATMKSLFIKGQTHLQRSELKFPLGRSIVCVKVMSLRWTWLEQTQPTTTVKH